MKWFIFIFILSFLTKLYSNAQTITIGTSTTTTTSNPVKSNSAYTYSQQIYLGNEGTASLMNTQANKYVTVIRFYWAGSGTLANSQSWAIYLGNTSQATFTTTSWVSSANLTQVYSGTVALPAAAGWLSITLTTPFLYTGNNLVVAVDENTLGASANLASWRCTSTSASYRSIYAAGTTNYNPTAPPTGITSYLRPNIQFDFAIPTSPTSITANPVTICEGASSLLTRNGASGTTYWFAGACGNTIAASIGTGSTLTVSPTVTTTYYCKNYNNGMWSANCASTTIIVNPIPANPPAPTSNSPNCGSVTINANPPPAGVSWYWQTTAAGTSQANTGNSFTVNTSGTYFLRAMSNAGCWSSASSSITVSVLALPPTPSTPTSNSPQCDSVLLTRSNTLPAGITWYWQGTNATGTLTSNNAQNVIVNTSGTYYLRALNNSGCWSQNSAAVNVIIAGHPSVPATPVSNSPQCDTVTLSWAGNPAQGVNWYWQTIPNGISTLNALSTWKRSQSGTYYLNARNSYGCWSVGSSSIPIVVTGYPFSPNVPISTSPNCDSVVLTMSGVPQNNVTWYWQGTQPNGASTINTAFSTPVYNSGTYYIRARNYANCWSINSTPITVVVHHDSYASINPSACDQYTAPDGQIYSSSGQFQASILNHLGCDSIITIELNVYPTFSIWDTQIACDSYTWIDGNTYTSDNSTATYTYQSMNGCDSIIHLNLDLGLTPDTVIIQGTAVDAFEFNGIFYTNEGLYSQTLINQYGCDSVIQLNIIIESAGISEEVKTEISVFPNPSSDGKYYVKNYETLQDLSVFDALGKEIFIEKGGGYFDISKEKGGVYFLNIKTFNGNSFILKLILNSN
jgi:hypothetical protein